MVAEYFPKLLSLFGRKEVRRPEEKSAVMEYVGSVVPTLNGLPDKILRLQRFYADFKNKWSRPTQPGGKADTTSQDSVRIDGLQVIINGLLELATLDAATAKCNQNLLPPRLVRLDSLRDAVEKAEKYLLRYGAEPLVAKSDVTGLYNIRAAQCTVSNDKFIINLRLPIRRMGDVLELIDLYPVPFKVKDVACTLIPQPITVALIGSRAAFLPVTYCPKEEFFCAIPRDSNPSEIPACLTSLFADEVVQTRECKPTCMRSEEPVVTEAADGRFWISTDADFPLSVECPDQPQVRVPNHGAGSIVIDLPCACRIMYGSKTIVTEKILCDNTTMDAVVAKAVVPVQWTMRTLSSFRSLVHRPTTVRISEVRIREEAEVPLTTPPREAYVPNWVFDLLAALGGSIALAVGTVIARTCCRRGQKTDGEGPVPVASPSELMEAGRELVRLAMQDQDDRSDLPEGGYSRRPRSYHEIRRSVLALDM